MADTICPRDAHRLQQGEFHTVPLMHCAECDGVLIKQPSLMTLLLEMAKELAIEISFEAEIDLIEDKGANLDCPACHEPMQNYGYMGARHVMIDSCGACTTLWIDANELATMCIMNERANQRLKQHQDSIKEHSNQLDKYVLQDVIHGAYMRGLRHGYGMGLIF